MGGLMQPEELQRMIEAALERNLNIIRITEGCCNEMPRADGDTLLVVCLSSLTQMHHNVAANVAQVLKLTPLK
jgi:hypothetical protein